MRPSFIFVDGGQAIHAENREHAMAIGMLAKSGEDMYDLFQLSLLVIPLLNTHQARQLRQLNCLLFCANN
jgi:hypothetical protein